MTGLAHKALRNIRKEVPRLDATAKDSMADVRAHLTTEVIHWNATDSRRLIICFDFTDCTSLQHYTRTPGSWGLLFTKDIMLPEEGVDNRAKVWREQALLQQSESYAMWAQSGTVIYRAGMTLTQEDLAAGTPGEQSADMPMG